MAGFKVGEWMDGPGKAAPAAHPNCLSPRCGCDGFCAVQEAVEEERAACAAIADEGAYYSTADGAMDAARVIAKLIRERARAALAKAQINTAGGEPSGGNVRSDVPDDGPNRVPDRDPIQEVVERLRCWRDDHARSADGRLIPIPVHQLQFLIDKLEGR